MTAATAATLGERGVDRLTATVVARMGVATFAIAFQEWTDRPDPPEFPLLMDEAFAPLRALALGSDMTPS